jgi:hypothetical protein
MKQPINYLIPALITHRRQHFLIRLQAISLLSCHLAPLVAFSHVLYYTSLTPCSRYSLSYSCTTSSCHYPTSTSAAAAAGVSFVPF